jgi:hypothetical protein
MMSGKRKFNRGKMTTFIVFIGILLCGIIITSGQIRAGNRKELKEIMDLFDNNNSS